MIRNLIGVLTFFFVATTLLLFYYALPAIGLYLFVYSFFAEASQDMIEFYRWGGIILFVGVLICWLKFPFRFEEEKD